MKHALRFTLLILGIYGTLPVLAQTDKVIDFMALPKDMKFPFKRKEVVRLKIINVNRFLYKVSTEKTETDFHMTVPAVLSGIKLPAFINTKAPAEGTPAPRVVMKDGPQSESEWENDIENNIKALISIQQSINAAVDVHNQALNRMKSCNETTQEIIQNVTNDLKRTLSDTRNNTVPSLANELQVKLSSNISDAKSIETDLENQYQAWQKENLKHHRNNFAIEKANLILLQEELGTLQEKLKKAKELQKTAIKSEISSKQSEIRVKERKIAEIPEDQASVLKAMADKIEKAKSLIASVQKFNEEGKVYSIVDDIRKANESNFTYYSEDVKMLKDEVKITVTATAEGQMTCDKPNEKKFTAKLRTEGGVKLDFSTGVFANLGSNEFHGQEYYYQPVDGDHSTIIAGDAGKRVGLSIGALMHIYRRAPSEFKLGFAVGASTTTNVDALNFHLGPSLLLGDEERFCITAGLTLRQVKVLDRRFSEGMSYEKALLPESVSMVNKFPVAGAFFALTYNLSRFNK